jgi:hypothetical protein
MKIHPTHNGERPTPWSGIGRRDDRRRSSLDAPTPFGVRHVLVRPRSARRRVHEVYRALPVVVGGAQVP